MIRVPVWLARTQWVVDLLVSHGYVVDIRTDYIAVGHGGWQYIEQPHSVAHIWRQR